LFGLCTLHFALLLWQWHNHFLPQSPPPLQKYVARRIRRFVVVVFVVILSKVLAKSATFRQFSPLG
jgi:hypothetical protein